MCKEENSEKGLTLLRKFKPKKESTAQHHTTDRAIVKMFTIVYVFIPANSIWQHFI